MEEGSKVKNKRKTVVDIIEDVLSDICDHYCKYPDIYKEEEEDKLYEHCDKCPLNRLM